MKNFNINYINSSYIDQLVNLEKESFSTPWSYSSFYDSFNNKNYKFIAAIGENNNILGYIGSYNILEQCYITNIAVYHQYKNQGVASQLLDKLISNSIINHIDIISLEVRISNIIAIKLYKKFNFKQVGIRKNFYQNPIEDAFIFNLTLHNNP